MTNVRWIENSVEELLELIRDYAEAHDGEVSEELDNRLNALLDAKETSIELLAIEYKSLMTKVSMYKAQEKALAIARKEVESLAQAKVIAIGLGLKGEKYNSKTSAVTYRKSTSLFVEDESAVPSEYIKTKTVDSIDKKAVTKAIKDGGDIAGCRLMENINVVVK